MAYAHGKRLYNRGLAPQSILVRDPDGDAPRLQISNWQVASRSEGTSVGAAMTAGTLHVEDRFADPAKVYAAPDAVADGDEGAARTRRMLPRCHRLPHCHGAPACHKPVRPADRLREGNGLVLSGTMNGAGRRLEELARVYADRSTAPPAALAHCNWSTVVVCFRYRLRPD
jgi:hypothetical protein